MINFEPTIWAEALPDEKIPAALAQLAAAQATLAGRLMSAPAPDAPIETTWLSVEEAASKIGRSPRWFYRNAKRLPFVKRLSRKVLLVGEQGMLAWIAARKA